MIVLSLGFLGMINSVALGLYILFTYMTISFIITPIPLYVSYLGSGISFFCIFLLWYGTYSIWKGQKYRGGLANLSAGMILALIYLYFTFLSIPHILSWLKPMGFFLPTPSILSGLIGLMIKNSTSSKKSTQSFKKN